MMKKVIIAIMLTVSLCLNSCIVDNNKYKESDIFEEFETQKGFTILHLPPVLFRIVISLSDDNVKESKELLDKVEVIKVLFYQENENTELKVTGLNKKINENIGEFEYKLLTKIADEDNDIAIYVIDKEQVIYEVLITLMSEGEYIGFNIVGELTKDEVFKIYKMLNTDNIQINQD